MPRIPLYVATEGVPLVEQPRQSGSLLAAPFESLRQGAQAIESSGQMVLRHIAYVNEQFKEQERIAKATELIGETTREFGIAEEELRKGKFDPETRELVEVPATHEDYFKRFQDKSNAIRARILERAGNDPRVAQIVQKNFATTFPLREVAAREHEWHLKQQYVARTADEQGESFVRAITTATDPIEKERMTRQYETSLQSMVPALGDKNVGERLIRFREKLVESRAELMATNTPELFRQAVEAGEFKDADQVMVSRQLTHARAVENQQMANVEKWTRHVREIHETNWSAQANLGILSQVDIANALAGHHPFITPDKAREYERINALPPSPTSDVAVHALRQEYRSAVVERGNGLPTTELFQKYRTKALQMQNSLTRPNEALSTFLNELSNEQVQLQGLDRQGFANAYKIVEGEYRKLIPPATGLGFADKLSKNRTAIEQAQYRNAMFDAWVNGGTPEDLKTIGLQKIEEIKRNREEKLKALPQEQKDRQRLYQK